MALALSSVPSPQHSARDAGGALCTGALTLSPYLHGEPAFSTPPTHPTPSTPDSSPLPGFPRGAL